MGLACWPRGHPSRPIIVSGGTAVDFMRIFGALPTPYLVLDRDLVTVGANDAYLAEVGRDRDEILGTHLLVAFPPQPDALDETGVPHVQRALERARDTGRVVTLPLQHDEVAGGPAGQPVERYWSLTAAPVVDDAGQVDLLLWRVEDVSDYVTERGSATAGTRGDADWHPRVAQIESRLHARAHELASAESRASARLAALADVALRLSLAQTVSELTDVVVQRGAGALQADGGALAVRHGGSLQLDLAGWRGSSSLADGALALHGPSPMSVVAVTGERVLVPDAVESARWRDALEAAVRDTGCRAWAVLPLRTDEGLLGSLTVGWHEPHVCDDTEIEMLEALAAQCSLAVDRIQRRDVERATAAADARMSETLQRSMLTEPPRLQGMSIAVRYRPAAQEAQVGGDWYDAVVTTDGATTIVIGDVSGHDGAAAASMGQLRNLLRGLLYAVDDPPAAVLDLLDHAMHDLEVRALATAVLATIGAAEPGAGPGRLLRWANAGHPPPLLVDADGTASLLRHEPDLLLGLDLASGRSDHERWLAPGSTVVLYTDGLVERRGASIEDGFAWLLKVMSGRAVADLEASCDALLADVGGYAEDDIALLLLRVDDV